MLCNGDGENSRLHKIVNNRTNKQIIARIIYFRAWRFIICLLFFNVAIFYQNRLYWHFLNEQLVGGMMSFVYHT